MKDPKSLVCLSNQRKHNQYYLKKKKKSKADRFSVVINPEHCPVAGAAGSAETAKEEANPE